MTRRVTHSAASKKGAAVRKAMKVRRGNRFGPEGSHRGSDQVRFSIADTLERIRASQADEAGG